MQTGAGNEEGWLEHGRAEEQYHEPSGKRRRNRGRVSALREQSGARGKLSQQRKHSGEAATAAPAPKPPEMSPASAPTFPQPAETAQPPPGHLPAGAQQPLLETAVRREHGTAGGGGGGGGGALSAAPGPAHRGAGSAGPPPLGAPRRRGGRRHRLRISSGRRSSASPRPRPGAGAGLPRAEPRGSRK